jgi:hypothetical protein
LDKGKALPRWLLFKTSNGQFEGVPDVSDVGEVYVRVQAWGAKGDVARDVFAINVVPKTSYQIPECDAGQDRLQISVLVDAQLKNIGPKRRVAAIRNLAGFLSVSPVSHKSASDVNKNNRYDIEISGYCENVEPRLGECRVPARRDGRGRRRGQLEARSHHAGPSGGAQVPLDVRPLWPLAAAGKTAGTGQGRHSGRGAAAACDRVAGAADNPKTANHQSSNQGEKTGKFHIIGMMPLDFFQITHLTFDPHIVSNNIT